LPPHATRLYYMYMVLGVGSVLPSYVLVATVDYVELAFPGDSMMSKLNFVFNGTLLLSCIANAYAFHQYGFTMRIVLGFMGTCVALAAVPITDFPWSKWLEVGGHDLHRALIICFAAVLGTSNGFVQGPLYAVTAVALPPIFTQALLFGVAACGTSVTLVRIVCKVAVPSSVRASAYVFFAFSAAFSLASWALWLAARRSSLFRTSIDFAMKHSPTLARRAVKSAESSGGRVSPNPTEEGAIKATAGMTFGKQLSTLLRMTPVISSCAMLVTVNTQFFMVVPSIVALSTDFIGQGWYHVLVILAYNVADLCGRGPAAACWPCPMRWVWPGVALRMINIGAICVCVAWSNCPLPLLLLVSIHGASTGWLSTSVASLAATRVAATDKETTGYLNIFSIVLGLLCGSALAFPLEVLVSTYKLHVGRAAGFMDASY